MRTRLADFIESTGGTQSEFCRRFGFAPPMVCEWVNGTRRPGRDNALALEAATGGQIPASYWKKVAVVNDRRNRPRRRRRAG